jgi:hypothetical protein
MHTSRLILFSPYLKLSFDYFNLTLKQKELLTIFFESTFLDWLLSGETNHILRKLGALSRIYESLTFDSNLFSLAQIKTFRLSPSNPLGLLEFLLHKPLPRNLPI